MSDEMLKDAYNTLLEFAASMDYENAVFVLGELKNYKVSETDQKRLNEINAAVERLDWDAVTEIAGRDY